jgi:hypothetical protein
MQAQFSNCTLVSIAAIDDAASETSALVMAKRLGSSCRAILVTNDELLASAQGSFGQILDVTTGKWRDQQPLDEAPVSNRTSAKRVRRYLAVARSVGIEVDISVLEAGQALACVRAVPREGLLILMQPADPLVRQSHPFTRLRHAALLAQAPTLFAPPCRLPQSNGILVLARGNDDPAIQLAEQMGYAISEPVERCGASRLDALDPAWGTRRSCPPTLIVKTRDEQLDDPASVSRNTLRLRVPVLLIDPELVPE